MNFRNSSKSTFTTAWNEVAFLRFLEFLIRFCLWLCIQVCGFKEEVNSPSHFPRTTLDGSCRSATSPSTSHRWDWPRNAESVVSAFSDKESLLLNLCRRKE